jgi:type II secretory pathway pseudopilin PulG
MRISGKFVNHGRGSKNSERGYILLMMMLFVTLLAIFAAGIANNMAFEIKRDQETEMIHRGVQYSRAVRKYVKKVGRYPSRLEDLENTSNVRFLRKRYKDPLTGKDFKLLHQSDVQLGVAAGLAGATSAAQLASGLNGQNLGGAQGLIAAQGIAAAAAQAQQQQQPLQNQDADTDAPNGHQSDNKDTLAGQQFGGGPIVGVASTSKKKTIREFNKKNHYNQWQFIYDPTMDRGGLITTPAQPPLQVTAPNVNGKPGTNGTNSFGGANFGGGQLGPGGLPIQPQQPPQNPPQ